MRINLERCFGIEGHEDENGYVLFLVVESDVVDPKMNFVSAVPSGENAGFDLVAAESHQGTLGGPAHLLDLGVRAMLVSVRTREPVHYWLLPRSSIYKTGHMMANSVGVIDAGYRGILKAPVVCTTIAGTGFKAGERYFQIVAPDMGQILHVERVKSLPGSERGEGGFGSTGL